MIVREAEGRSDLLLQNTQARLSEIEREITELKLRRRDVEASLAASISALHNALDFIRAKDQGDRDEKLLLHRPRPAAEAVRAAVLDDDLDDDEADEDEKPSRGAQARGGFHARGRCQPTCVSSARQQDRDCR
jgi:hypothetical protein